MVSGAARGCLIRQFRRSESGVSAKSSIHFAHSCPTPKLKRTSRISRTSVSPLFLVGLRFPIRDRLSFNLSASWASYSDTFRSFDREFDLSPSGWTLRPVLQLKF
jgi:hypothetical protein